MSLNIWLPFPITISCSNWTRIENIIAALEHRHRITQIIFNVKVSTLEKFAAVMLEPLMILTHRSIFI